MPQQQDFGTGSGPCDFFHSVAKNSSNMAVYPLVVSSVCSRGMSIESIDPGTPRQCGGKDDVQGQGGVNDLRRQMIEANKLPRSSHGSNMNGYMNGYPSWIVHGKSETTMDDDWGTPMLGNLHMSEGKWSR